MYLVIGIVLAFIVSFWKDNRSLWNPVLFLLSLISSYFYLSYLFYKNGYENVQLAFYVFAFVLLPFLLFLSGIFLIYNEWGHFVEARGTFQAQLSLNAI